MMSKKMFECIQKFCFPLYIKQKRRSRRKIPQCYVTICETRCDDTKKIFKYSYYFYANIRVIFIMIYTKKIINYITYVRALSSMIAYCIASSVYCSYTYDNL